MTCLKPNLVWIYEEHAVKKHQVTFFPGVSLAYWHPSVSSLVDTWIGIKSNMSMKYSIHTRSSLVIPYWFELAVYSSNLLNVFFASQRPVSRRSGTWLPFLIHLSYLEPTCCGKFGLELRAHTFYQVLQFWIFYFQRVVWSLQIVVKWCPRVDWLRKTINQIDMQRGENQ